MNQRTSLAPMAIAREERVSARNYAPLPVVVSRARDCWIEDIDGRRYLDLMSAYSAVSHGHLHPRLVAAMKAQLQRVAVASRAYHSDTLGPFLERLCAMSGFERALPMNTGAEAVETAIKAARRWGYRVKGVPAGRARILVARNNFHGRTSTIIGFSSDEAYRADFGPFADGFRSFDFGDMASVRQATTDDCCAVLIEPIQGEAGIIVPPAGWFAQLRRWCDERGMLLIADEVQSGLGRTGRLFAFEHEGIRPDALILGKALGGGLLPVSAFLADDALMSMFEPNSHGSTFGGNALAAAVGLEALAVIEDEHLVERSAVLGRHLMRQLSGIDSPLVRAVRGRGLWVGIDIDPARATARDIVLRLAERGVLSKETHDTVIRIAPPLTIGRDDLDWGVERLRETLRSFDPPAAVVRQRSVVAPAQPTAALARPEAALVRPGAALARPTQPVAATLLVSPPEHFEVSYRINPWMDPKGWSDQAESLSREARDQWRALTDRYRALGAQLHILPAMAGLPDLVFTANAAVVLDRKVLLARFRNPERQGEMPVARAAFESLRDQGIVDSLHETAATVRFEGAGDAIWDTRRQLLWMGHGQRSDFAARDAARAVFGVQTLSLELIDPRFYHLDTCFCVLGDSGHVLWYPSAFSLPSQKMVRALLGRWLIDASAEDAEHLGVNSVTIGRDVVMGWCSENLATKLRQRGLTVHRVDLSTFNRSGGAAYCLTLRLDLSTGPMPDHSGRTPASRA